MILFSFIGVFAAGVIVGALISAVAYQCPMCEELRDSLGCDDLRKFINIEKTRRAIRSFDIKIGNKDFQANQWINTRTWRKFNTEE